MSFSRFSYLYVQAILNITRRRRRRYSCAAYIMRIRAHNIAVLYTRTYIFIPQQQTRTTCTDNNNNIEHAAHAVTKTNERSHNILYCILSAGVHLVPCPRPSFSDHLRRRRRHRVFHFRATSVLIIHIILYRHAIDTRRGLPCDGMSTTTRTLPRHLYTRIGTRPSFSYPCILYVRYAMPFRSVSYTRVTVHNNV